MVFQKKFHTRFFLGIILLFTSCKSCKDKVIDCPGFPSDKLIFIPVFNQEQIDYTDSSGNILQFKARSEFASEASQRACRTSFPTPPCKCYEEPNAYCIFGTNDTVWVKRNANGGVTEKFFHLSYDAIRNGDNRYQISTTILDAGIVFMFENSIELQNNDQLLPTFEIGGKFYKDVIFHQVDTANNSYHPYSGLNENFVHEIYYTTSQGIIAFKDLKTKRYYFLK